MQVTCVTITTRIHHVNNVFHRFCILLVLLMPSALIACNTPAPSPVNQDWKLEINSTLKTVPSGSIVMSVVSVYANGRFSHDVTWKASQGTITPASRDNVTYTAPAFEGTFSVTATSKQNSAKFVTVLVQVANPVIYIPPDEPLDTLPRLEPLGAQPGRIGEMHFDAANNLYMGRYRRDAVSGVWSYLDGRLKVGLNNGEIVLDRLGKPYIVGFKYPYAWDEVTGSWKRFEQIDPYVNSTYQVLFDDNNSMVVLTAIGGAYRVARYEAGKKTWVTLGAEANVTGGSNAGSLFTDGDNRLFWYRPDDASGAPYEFIVSTNTWVKIGSTGLQNNLFTPQLFECYSIVKDVTINGRLVHCEIDGIYLQNPSSKTWERLGGPTPFKPEVIAVSQNGGILASVRYSPWWRLRTPQSSWELLALPHLSTADVRQIRFVSEDEAYVTSAAGVYALNLNTKTWRSLLAGDVGLTPNKIVIDDNQTLLGMLNDERGIWQRPSNQNTWASVNAPWSNTQVWKDLTRDSLGHIVVLGKNNQIFARDKTYEYWAPNHFNSSSLSEFRTLRFDREDRAYLMDVYGAVQRSGTNFDGGNLAWYNQIAGLKTCIDVLEFNSKGTLYAGTAQGCNSQPVGSGGVYQRTSNAAEWTQINQGLTELGITNFPERIDRIVVAPDDTVYLSTPELFKRGPNATSWTKISSDWTYSLTVDRKGHLYSVLGTALVRFNLNTSKWEPVARLQRYGEQPNIVFDAQNRAVLALNTGVFRSEPMP
jgi:hypothetical protein